MSSARRRSTSDCLTVRRHDTGASSRSNDGSTTTSSVVPRSNRLGRWLIPRSRLGGERLLKHGQSGGVACAGEPHAELRRLKDLRLPVVDGLAGTIRGRSELPPAMSSQ
jgi:hypothetical protein